MDRKREAARDRAAGLLGLDQRRMQQVLVLAGLLLVFLIVHIAADFRFLTARNLGIIISHAVIPTFVTWGMVFSFTSGMIDLSVGAIVILASNLLDSWVLSGAMPAFCLGAWPLVYSCRP